MTKNEIISENKPVLVGGFGEINFGKQYRQGNRIYNANNIAMCLTSNPLGNTGGYSYLYLLGDKMKTLRIRKLTPRCCFKLMGLTFEDCDKAAAVGVSDSQLYKQAGNGIVVSCVKLLMQHLYKSQYDETYKCSDENFQNPQLD